jgi:hypothetical protein
VSSSTANARAPSCTWTDVHGTAVAPRRSQRRALRAASRSQRRRRSRAGPTLDSNSTILVESGPPATSHRRGGVLARVNARRSDLAGLASRSSGVEPATHARAVPRAQPRRSRCASRHRCRARLRCLRSRMVRDRERRWHQDGELRWAGSACCDVTAGPAGAGRSASALEAACAVTYRGRRVRCAWAAVCDAARASAQGEAEAHSTGSRRARRRAPGDRASTIWIRPRARSGMSPVLCGRSSRSGGTRRTPAVRALALRAARELKFPGQRKAV